MPPPNWKQIHKWITWGAGLLCLLIGALGILGWHLHYMPLLQVVPGGPIIRYNAALGYLLGGTILLCLPLRSRFNVSRYLGIFMFAFGFVTFIQMPLGITLGIDTFFTSFLIGPIPPELSTSPSIITLLIFMFAGIAFILFPGRDSLRLPVVTILTLALLIQVLGYFGLLSFIVPIQTNLFDFSGPVGIAFLTSLGAIFLGMGINAYISLCMLKYQRTSTWAKPYISGIGFLFFSLLITYGLYTENSRTLKTEIASKMELVERLGKKYINNQADSLATFDKHLALMGDDLTPQNMNRVAALYLQENPAFTSLYLLDDSFHLLGSATRNETANKEPSSSIVNNLAKSPLNKVPPQDITIYYNPTDKTLIIPSFFVAKNGKKVIIISESDTFAFFQASIYQLVNELDTVFFINGEQVYDAHLEHVLSWEQELILNIHGLTLLIKGYPTPKLVHSLLEIPLILIVFFSTVFLGLGTSFLLYLFEKSKQLTATLRGYKEKLNLALQSAGLTSWTYDVAKDEITWDENSVAYFAGSDSLHSFRLPKTYPEFLGFIHPDDIPLIIDEAKKIARHGAGLHSTFRVIRPNGQISFNEAQATVFYNEAGRPMEVAGICRNVTKEFNLKMIQRLHLQVIRTVNEANYGGNIIPLILKLLGESLQLAAVAYFWLNPKTNLLECLESWTGPYIGAEEFRGGSLCDTCAKGMGFPGQVWEAQKAVWGDNLADRSAHKGIDEVKNSPIKAGFAFPIKVHNQFVGVVEFFQIVPFAGEVDQLYLALGDLVGAEIGQYLDKVETEAVRLQKEEELRKSEEKFRILVETTNDWVWAIDANRKITFSNISIKSILGYLPEEIMGTDFFRLLADDTREKTEKEFTASRDKKQGWTARLNKWKHKNGEIRWLESSATPILSPSCELLGYRGNEWDITERIGTSKIKNEFVAMVSHELRTPLTSIKGALALVVRNLNMTPEKIAQLLAIALSNCDRLITLVNDILNMEKLEAGKIEIHLQPIEVLKVIEDSVDENKQFAEKFGKQLVVEHVPSNIKVFSDPARLLQVLSNLISNAVKFSPPLGKIYIKVEDSQTCVRFSIRDEGEGIPEEFQIHIFEKFMRANVLESSAVPGTGLGLNISKQLIQRLGGTINFISKKNVGTTFYFDLPKYYDAIPLIRPVISREKICTLLVFSQDQMPDKAFGKIVKECGFACENFAHFEEVRTALQERDFGALMLDLDHFNSDNINFLRRLCKTRQFTIPLILVSSAKTEEALTDARLYDDFPVLGWLTKPINSVDVKEILEKLKNQIYAGKATVLYVDNDISLVETVKTLLLDQVLVRTALTLAEARQILERESIDLLLLDIYLPDGLGTELLPAINCKTAKRIPVVVFSIDEDSSHSKGSVEKHLVKARTTNQELIDTVMSVLKSQRELQIGNLT